jgi:sugar phosphate isomerase/epimerase
MPRDLRTLSLNTATLGFTWPLARVIGACAAAGLGGIAPWRRDFSTLSPADARTRIADAGLIVTGLCRGGYLVHGDAAQRDTILDDNRRAIDEAQALGAPSLCIVVGGLPPGSRDLAAGRAQVVDILSRLAEHAAGSGVRLGVEPLHPMYAADRSCISTLASALDMCDAVGGDVGVIVDTYHVWWDPDLEAGLRRAGLNRLLGWHLADWRVPTRDLLMDRAMIGEGVIDFARIERMVRAAGWAGLSEVEIFSDEWNARGPAETLAALARNYGALDEPSPCHGGRN